MDITNMSDEVKEYVKSIIECIDDGIFITDGEGNVVELNQTALGSLKREDLVGKNMAQLIDEGVYEDSVTLKVIDKKAKVTQFQHEETEILTTGIPHMEGDKVDMVVCCERELKELEIMKKQIRINEEKLNAYREEIDYLRSITTKDVDVIIESREMKKVLELALIAAKYDSRVLLEGETGVGKEIIAKIIYKNGTRKNGPFITVNCSAIPESLLESELFGYEKGSFTGANESGKLGYFELANNGVLFLDEIGDISLNFQAKLLRALQEEEIQKVGGQKKIGVDVQIIAASNKSLEEKVGKGEFRADLFYRLNNFPIQIPPLRERRKDIVPLIYTFAESFNKKYDKQKEFSLSSLNVLQQYKWPGNVRELENIIERLVLTVNEDIIEGHHVRSILGVSSDIPADFHDGTMKEVVESVEKNLIRNYMEIYENPADLEKALDISRATLNRKLLKYNLR